MTMHTLHCRELPLDHRGENHDTDEVTTNDVQHHPLEIREGMHWRLKTISYKYDFMKILSGDLLK